MKLSSGIVSVVECDVYSGVVEFKNDSIKFEKGLYQTYADMIKAGTDCALTALCSDKIVKEVIVFGLFTCIDLRIAKPLKYSINFTTGNSTFEIANDEVDFLKHL